MNSIDSDQLDAFEAVARLGGFSLAAAELHLTQPALSRRIQALEQELEASVFIRGPGGTELTEAGHRLLAYAQTRKALEGELRFDLASRGKAGALGGTVRIAGYSTVLSQVVLPTLAPFLRKHPAVQLQFVATQGVRPPGREVLLLRRAEVDFLIGAYPPPERPDIVVHRLGHQELVAMESTKYRGREDTFLDTRPEDPTTEIFLAAQKGPRNTYRRSFLHDEDGLLAGALQGLGRAVLLRTIVPASAPLREVPGWRPTRWSVYLMYRNQPHTSKLLKEARRVLEEGCPAHLR